MAKLLVLMNHELLQTQKEDAIRSLSITDFIYPPEYIQNIWMNIPPEKEEITDIIEPILSWIAQQSQAGDYVLVHGDFGATVLIVSWALQNDRIPIYATTQRNYQKKVNENGEIINVHTFNHVRFRQFRLR